MFLLCDNNYTKQRKKKKNSFIIPEHKSLRQSMKETQVAQKGLPVAYIRFFCSLKNQGHWTEKKF